LLRVDDHRRQVQPCEIARHEEGRQPPGTLPRQRSGVWTRDLL